MSIISPIPNGPFYSTPSNYINSPQGLLVVGTGLAVDPSGTILSASALGGTVTQVTAGIGLSGGTITSTGTINLLPATNVSLGGIKIGANLLISSDGTLSALPPGTGTISGVTAGNGLQGGGLAGNVTLNLLTASTTQFGGVSVNPTGGISVSSGTISLSPASETQVGGISLATSAEVIAGAEIGKAVTPATLQAKVASTTAKGIVQLSDSVAINDSTKAATQTAAKTAYDAAISAQMTAGTSLPKSGGTMTGVIAFAPAQTFPGVSFPIATSTSPGVIQLGSGLIATPGGVVSTTNNGTVTAIVPGPGLGAPATGNPITTSGVLRLLPPTLDGIQLGGVKAGDNVTIAADGTLGVTTNSFLATNNPYSYNGYQWPIPNAPGPGPIPLLPCPGNTGQVLTILNNVNGQIGWTDSGTLTSVAAGTGIQVVSTPTTATVSLAIVPSIVPGDFGGTALIPTLQVNEYGQLTSIGQANPYTPFQTASSAALDFQNNNLNWEFTLAGNTVFSNPLNAQSGQTGSILLRQSPLATYTITWGSSWKFQGFTPFTGGGLAEVTLLKFTVVAANYIVVDTVVTNIG